jgi:hypothetical protein
MRRCWAIRRCWAMQRTIPEMRHPRDERRMEKISGSRERVCTSQPRYGVWSMNDLNRNGPVKELMLSCPNVLFEYFAHSIPRGSSPRWRCLSMLGVFPSIGCRRRDECLL